MAILLNGSTGISIPGGTIGSLNTELYIGSTGGADAFIRLGSNAVVPAYSTGANRSAAISLGSSAALFKDLHLSGTATATAFAGDGSALTGVGVGAGQSWQDVRTSRVLTTSYQNTTSLPIQVMVISSKANSFEISSDNTTWVSFGNVGASGAYDESRAVIIPVNHYYKVGTGVGAVEIWAELR